MPVENRKEKNVSVYQKLVPKAKSELCKFVPSQPPNLADFNLQQSVLVISCDVPHHSRVDKALGAVVGSRNARRIYQLSTLARTSRPMSQRSKFLLDP